MASFTNQAAWSGGRCPIPMAVLKPALGKRMRLIGLPTSDGHDQRRLAAEAALYDRMPAEEYVAAIGCRRADIVRARAHFGNANPEKLQVISQSAFGAVRGSFGFFLPTHLEVYTAHAGQIKMDIKPPRRELGHYASENEIGKARWLLHDRTRTDDERDVNACNLPDSVHHGCPALLLAAESGKGKQAHHEFVYMLLDEYNADINVQSRPHGGTALIFAAQSNDHKLLKGLLWRGAAVNVVDAKNCSPLWFACGAPHKLECISLLLAAGADPNIASQTMPGWSRQPVPPLQLACSNCRTADHAPPTGKTLKDLRTAVKMLLEAGASTAFDERDDLQAPFGVAFDGPIVANLIKNGTNPNLRQRRPLSELLHLQKDPWMNVGDIPAGPAPGVDYRFSKYVDGQGWVELADQSQAQSRIVTTITLLALTLEETKKWDSSATAAVLGAGADANARFGMNDGKTALLCALVMGSALKVSILLHFGADPDAVIRLETSKLQVGNPPVLMELHPDITASNTPSVYDIAKTQNLTGIVEVFEARNDTRETDLDGLKAKADAAYSSKRVSDALAKYALWLITAQAQGGKQPPLAIAKVHSNRSACYVALKDSDSAMREADKCVALAPEWAKGHARRAVALLMRGFMDQSAAAYAQAAAIDRQWARQATASAKEAIARREIDVGKAIKAIISEPIQRRLQERIADDLGTDDAYAEVFAKDIGLGSPMAFPPAGSEARSLLLTHASWVRAMAFSRRVNSMILINNKSDYDRAAAQLAGPADDATAPLRAMLRKQNGPSLLEPWSVVEADLKRGNIEIEGPGEASCCYVEPSMDQLFVLVSNVLLRYPECSSFCPSWASPDGSDGVFKAFRKVVHMKMGMAEQQYGIKWELSKHGGSPQKLVDHFMRHISSKDVSDASTATFFLSFAVRYELVHSWIPFCRDDGQGTITTGLGKEDPAEQAQHLRNALRIAEIARPLVEPYMRPGMYCAAIEPTFIAGIRLRLLESLQRGVETEAKTTAIVEEAKKLLVYAERERPAMGLSWTAESERREPIGADASATAPRVDLHVFSASNPDNFEHMFINKPQARAHAALADVALAKLDLALGADADSVEVLLDVPAPPRERAGDVPWYKTHLDSAVEHLAKCLAMSANDDIARCTSAWKLAGLLALSHCELGMVRRAVHLAKALESKFTASALGRPLNDYDVPRKLWLNRALIAAAGQPDNVAMRVVSPGAAPLELGQTERASVEFVATAAIQVVEAVFALGEAVLGDHSHAWGNVD